MSNITNIEKINENDCCGNGCANCILDIKQVKTKLSNNSGKQNVLHRYTKFSLINKTLPLAQQQNVLELHFKSTEETNGQFILEITPGYHIMMRKPLTDLDERKESEIERKYLLRPYSPFWWDEVEMEFKILVNLKPNGTMTKYIKEFEINDEVEFRGPIGTFEYKEDLKGESLVVIITQGVAIAPAIPIIENILNNDEDMTRIIHLCCFQDLQHVYFREKLREFGKYWNYKVHIYLSQELCDNTDCLKNKTCLENCKNFLDKLKYKETIKPFRLTQQELQTIISRLEYKKDLTKIILAGIGSFQNFYKDLLKSADFEIPDNNIYLL